MYKLIKEKQKLRTDLQATKEEVEIFHPYQKSVNYLPQLKFFDTDTNRYASLDMKH